MSRLETKDKRRVQRRRANIGAIAFIAFVLMIGILLGCAVTAAWDQPEPIKAEVVTYDPPPEPMPEVYISEVETTNSRLHGSCRITAFCACSVCCGEWANNRPLDENGNPIVYGASGKELTPGVSVACSLPYGTKLEIDGLPGTYVVEDRTAEWIQDKYNGMTVDIYMDSHEACYKLLSGKPEWMDVYIVEGET